MTGTALLALVLSAAPARAAVFAPEAFARPAGPPLAAAALGGASPVLAPSAPMPGALPAPAALRASDGGEFPVVERRGRDRFGHEVVLLDALDARDPAAGTAAHVDFTLKRGQASLDDPLDLASTEKLPHPAGAPEGADLSHQGRPYQWFGLAVKPELQGRGLGAGLLDAAVAQMRAAGIPTLFIRATESSKDFYLRRFGASVRHVIVETDGDGGPLYRIEVDLSAGAAAPAAGAFFDSRQ